MSSKSEFEFITFQLIDEVTTSITDYSMPPLTTFPSECYQVASHVKRIPGSIDFTLIPYHKTKNSILFVKVKPLLAYDLDSSRKAADDLIRKRVSQLYGGKYPHPQALRN